MREPADIYKPALIAGAIFGTWSGIPILNLPNCACCSLIVGSGVLACFLMVRSGAAPVTWGRAALAGAMSGAIAALVSSMTGILVMAALGRSFEQNLQESVDRASQMIPAAAEAAEIMARIPSSIFLIATMIISVFIDAPFGALGGVLGRALFEKRAELPPTAPPSDVMPPASPTEGSGPPEGGDPGAEDSTRGD
ncbi:MAG TPA: hypothetical protein VGK94_05650 [Candidatus Polarisedimenticolia bacterium]